MDLDSLIERVESTHKKYLEARESFRSQKEADDATIKQLSDQISQLQEELTLAKADLESSILKQDEAEKQASVKSNRLNDEVDRLRKEVDELQKNAERFEEYKKSLQSELTDAHTETSSVQNKLAALEVSKKDVETAFAELKEKHNKLVSENSSSSELTSTIQTLSNTKVELENKITELESKVAELSKLVSEQEIMIGELNNNLSQKDATISSLQSTLPVKKTTNSNLEDFINSTIPVPENSAAINVRQVKRGSDISIGTVPYRFGRTSPKIMGQVAKLIDALYRGVEKNADGTYPLNSYLQAINESQIDSNTYNVTMERLKAMNFNGKPLIILSGNNYYGTLDCESLKNYLMES